MIISELRYLQSVLQEVKELYCIHDNFKDVPMGEILTWACLNGAKFLSKESELGTITPGKRPGIVLVNNVDAEGCFTSESCSVRLI